MACGINISLVNQASITLIAITTIMVTVTIFAGISTTLAVVFDDIIEA